MTSRVHVDLWIKRDGSVCCTGLIPGQILRLHLPSGDSYMIVRFGEDTRVCKEES